MSKSLSIIYFGSAAFAVPPLEFLLAHPGRFDVRRVVTQPAKPVGRRGLVTPTPVAETARRAGVELVEAATLKDDTLYEKLKALTPDLLIVAAYGKIIPKRYLEIPRVAPLNLHGSLLPKYRGASPIQAAILEGETETGVSLMVVDEQVDHGPVVAIERCAIAPVDTYDTLTTKLSKLGLKLLDEKLESYARGETPAREQNHSDATFTKIIEKNDGLVDFVKEDAARIERKFRAYATWPGIAFVWQRPSGSLRVKILKLRVIDAGGRAPTTRFLSPAGFPAVACKNGAIELLELQVEGKKAVDSKAFLNGYKNFIGNAS